MNTIVMCLLVLNLYKALIAGVNNGDQYFECSHRYLHSKLVYLKVIIQRSQVAFGMTNRDEEKYLLVWFSLRLKNGKNYNHLNCVSFRVMIMPIFKLFISY